MKIRTKQSFRGAILLLTLCMSAGMLSSCTQQPQNSASVTDGTAAHTDAGTEHEIADTLTFSAESGFYQAPFSLTLAAPDKAEIYYTLDGSRPTAESQHYHGGIEIKDVSGTPNTVSNHAGISADEEYSAHAFAENPIDKATVVRAVAVMPDGTESAVISHTYFVGFQEKAAYYQQMKIVSLMTEECNLFDEEKGIYVLGNAYERWKNSEDYDSETPDWAYVGNYTQKGREWEREAVIQIFDRQKPVMTQDIGIRIHGGATRSYPQKSFNVYARSDYGDTKIRYDLFSGTVIDEKDGSPITVFDSFTLRNSGNDAKYTRFRDRLNQTLVSDRQFLTQGMEPCIVFLNGEFWGQYDITEKLDTAWIKAHCGIPKKDVCIIKKDALDSGSEETFAEWKSLREWIQQTDFSDPSAYKTLCDRVDMQGFADYMSSEIYINNWDWCPANSAMWKAETVDENNPYADGKWRFVMFDTDFSAGIYGRTPPDEDNFANLEKKDSFLSDLFKSAMQNDDFRKQFVRTFREIAAQNFAEERVRSAIDLLESVYHDAAIDTQVRFWNGSQLASSARSFYQSEVDVVRDFYRERGEYILSYLDAHYGADAKKNP